MIKTVRSAILAAALMGVGATPALADEHAEEDAVEMTKGEKELAELLEGRVAGEPVRCIRNFPAQRMRVINDTAIVYGRGDTIYVQRTKHPENIDDDDVFVRRTFGTTQLCRLDNVTTVDRYTGFFSGVVFFDDFVPYSRAEG